MSTLTTTRARTWTAPRTHGMASGLGLVLLGAWGAVIPFVGPYFDYAYSPNKTWTWTAGRGYLEVLPGAVAFLAGLVLLLTAHRAKASLAASLGIAAGAWFVVGPLLTPLWNSNDVGSPVGGTRMIAVEQIGIFYGLGAAIVLFAAAALGRFSVVSVVSAPSAIAEPAVSERAPFVPAATQAMPAMPPAPDDGIAAPPDWNPGPAEPAAATAGMAPAGVAPAEPATPLRSRHSWLPRRHRHYAAH